MKTAFSTGPGFFAANTRATDDTIPAGTLRMLIARVEAYDGPLAKGTAFDQMEFKLLVEMADGRPDVARALLALHAALAGNLELLKAEAKQ